MIDDDRNPEFPDPIPHESAVRAAAIAWTSRAVTIRCVVCGLEVAGIELPDGRVRPSNGRHDAPVKDGWCMTHLPTSEKLRREDIADQIEMDLL